MEKTAGMNTFDFAINYITIEEYETFSIISMCYHSMIGKRRRGSSE